jgi:hypothetical protein
MLGDGGRTGGGTSSIPPCPFSAIYWSIVGHATRLGEERGTGDGAVFKGEQAAGCGQLAHVGEQARGLIRRQVEHQPFGEPRPSIRR